MGKNFTPTTQAAGTTITKIEATKIYNWLAKINKNGITDRDVKIKIIKNLIALQPVYKEVGDAETMALAAADIKDTDTISVKQQKAANITIMLEKKRNEKVCISFEQMTFDEIDKAMQDSGAVPMEAFLDLQPIIKN